MAVKVRVSVNGHDTFDKARAIALEGAHLLVRAPQGSGWRTIAIYPPGSWLDAVVED